MPRRTGPMAIEITAEDRFLPIGITQNEATPLIDCHYGINPFALAIVT
jgi:hypothetical protein